MDWEARTITISQQVQAIGSTITISTPNQIKSKPSAFTIGMTIGSVSTSIEKPSRNMPSAM